MNENEAKIITTALEDMMHESVMPYAEYVILQRALPRVEDGLKPVQRRILYSMYENGILPDKKRVKCARIVGDTMGKYHPHGDSSIYDALARMAQDYSMRIPLVDGQGNFGSQDGDSPAAMRYTEAKLAPLALELLRDIDKDTVDFALTFDDTGKEPVMLPARFPNLLISGTTGIAVGVATNIPPHNPGEVIDGTIYRMEHPKCSLDDVMQFIKGPDFPTGGVIYGTSVLRDIYTTGRGKIALRAKIETEKRGGKTLIVMTELPFEVRESALLMKIEQLRQTKKEMFSGISRVSAETDREGIRAVIELKNGADEKQITDCLLKYSDMQISYGMNMVAIAEGHPRQLALLEILDYYIAHQRRVLTRRVRFDIEQASKREHILSGLMKAVLNIDLVIKIIRGAENVRDAKAQLMEQLDLTGEQAQSILDLRLSRLTKLEVITLEREYKEVVELLQYLNELLESPAKLDGVIIGEVKEIRKKYCDKRRTRLCSDSGEIVIDNSFFEVSEDCTVILTRAGNIKRLPKKAAAALKTEIEEKNRALIQTDTQTNKRIGFLTEGGMLYTVLAEAIKESKPAAPGIPLTGIATGIDKNERVLTMLPPEQKGELLFVTAKGMVKRTDAAELAAKKTKFTACGLAEDDRLLLAEPLIPGGDILLVTRGGFAIRFSSDEISVQGRTAKGVVGVRTQDEVIYAVQLPSGSAAGGGLLTCTDAGYIKYTPVVEYEAQARGGKGQKTCNFGKGGAYGEVLAAAFLIDKPCAIGFTLRSGATHMLTTAQVPIAHRADIGEQLVPAMMGDTVAEAAQYHGGV